MTQGSWPRNHLPEKVVMGVRGAAVRHIIVSDSAMLHTNRLISVWRLAVLHGTVTKLADFGEQKIPPKKYFAHQVYVFSLL